MKLEILEYKNNVLTIKITRWLFFSRIEKREFWLSEGYAHLMELKSLNASDSSLYSRIKFTTTLV